MDCPPPFTANESSQDDKGLEGQNRLWVGCDTLPHERGVCRPTVSGMSGWIQDPLADR